MRHGHRTAVFDLLTKDRDHASIASQHVPEADCSILCRRYLGEHLDDHLADSLRSSHYIRRTDRLVCRDQNHLLHMELIRGACHIICTEHIVLDCLVRAVLHKRNVLVSRRVVYDIRMVCLENILDALLITHRCDQRLQIEFRIILLQFKLYIISIVFIDINNDQLFRIMKRHLTADLASDGTASAGHNDHFAGDVISDLLHMKIHRLSSKEILDTYIPQHRDVDLLIDHLVDARQYLDLARGLLTNLQQLVSVFLI